MSPSKPLLALVASVVSARPSGSRGHRTRCALLCVLGAFALVARPAPCQAARGSASAGSHGAAETIWHPTPGTRWQWQLTGTIDTTVDAAMYDVDLFETPQATLDELHAAGRVVVCYLSAGSWEAGRPDAAEFPESVLGQPLEAPFQDERWLDVRQTAILEPLMAARMDLAVAKGCDGVEPDNVDGYANSTGFAITYADQLAYNRLLAEMAHARSLSVGLKNDLDQIGDLVASFDWALDEQCWQYGECDLLAPFVAQGKAVFGVEYTGDPTVFCPPLQARGYSWLKKRIDLDAWRIDCRDVVDGGGGDGGGGGSTPAPPSDEWLTSPDLPGFEAQVRIESERLGVAEPICIAEALCVSGALPGRPEVFVKVIGPRPNGFLWVQISRFTPSRLEVWLRQVAGGETRYYQLEAVGPDTADVSGLQDREAFSP